jgi:DNA primase
MDAKSLKEHICENNYSQIILESIGCKHIKYHPSGHPDPYWTCANHDGNNNNAITLYNKPNLKCINYTRDIAQGSTEQADIFSLIGFIKNISFNESLKYTCDLLSIDYYSDFEDELPESIKLTKLILEMQSNEEIDEDKPLKPISEKILTYYKSYVNDIFANDGIDYLTQREFGIQYDDLTNRIVIPIYDEINSLVGIKGRLFKEELDEYDLKYLYIEPCARNKILYGLYKTYPFIKQTGKVFIGEAEKFCMQLWSMGIYNAVATGGTKISNNQIEKLSRLGVELIFAFDKCIKKKEIEEITERFLNGIKISVIYDEENILNDKESPSDNHEKFKYLIKNHIYKIK